MCDSTRMLKLDCSLHVVAIWLTRFEQKASEIDNSTTKRVQVAITFNKFVANDYVHDIEQNNDPTLYD